MKALHKDKWYGGICPYFNYIDINTLRSLFDSYLNDGYPLGL